MRSVDTASHAKAARTSNDKPVTGLVNKVLLQSFVDGPGNRAVIFLQGCNFNCLYCHNPYMINICNHCGLCVPQCPQGALVRADGRVLWDSSLCAECDRCIEMCPRNSSPQVRSARPHALWLEIEPTAPFLSGVTVSGGEATQQADFVRDFFTEVKAHSSLTTFIQTNGDVPRGKLAGLVPVTDGFMVDLKAFDAATHRRLTGTDNAQVLSTIRFLAEHEKLYQVRQVVVPGFSDTEASARTLARFLLSIDPTIALRFLRFRPHGARGVAATWEEPTDEIMEAMVSAATDEGLVHVDRSI